MEYKIDDSTVAIRLATLGFGSHSGHITTLAELDEAFIYEYVSKMVHKGSVIPTSQLEMWSICDVY